MSYNPNVTLKYVLDNPYKEWIPEALGYIFTFNPEEYFINDKYYMNVELNLSIDEIKKYGIKNKSMLSCNPNISWNYIIENLNIKWNFASIARYNKYMTPEIIIKYSEYFNEECINNLSLNKNIKWEDIEKHPEIKWNYRNLSLNPNITIDIVNKNLEKDWDYNNLSMNKNITMEIIKKNKKLNKKMYIYNSNLKLKDLEEYDYFDDTMIKYICINNYDEERKEYIKENNINYNIKNDIDMLEYVCL